MGIAAAGGAGGIIGGTELIQLKEIDEANFFAARALSVSPEQRGFLDDAVGILARGYLYRRENARVWAIEADGEVVGLALVKDMDEPPACYDLQQFMIDRRFQNRGCGTRAAPDPGPAVRRAPIRLRGGLRQAGGPRRAAPLRAGGLRRHGLRRPRRARLPEPDVHP